ncbi:hypothetical protein IFM89_022393 [Coptis chinensis]|uniref:Uncharacterized protein n=1 Tax=Coptis chinensis TaxID=261450 RepID=A0A835J1H0_9MAGN|nr:hypothetical protein IFM89_022393 [Coptis chinensis]
MRRKKLMRLSQKFVEQGLGVCLRTRSPGWTRPESELFVELLISVLGPETKLGYISCTVSNAYLDFLRGAGVMTLFDFVKEMPQDPPKELVDPASFVGALFYTWFILNLFPVRIINFKFL